jgi:hypothetical protein
VVGAGVSPAEKVVVDGQLNLIPGTKVEVKGEQPLNGNPKSQMTGTK